MPEEKKTNLTIPVLVGLLVVAGAIVLSLYNKVKTLEKESVQPPSPAPTIAAGQPSPEVLGEQLESTIGNFQITKEEICQEKGKPVVYFFGSSGCSHCVWNKPIFEKTTKKFGDKISVHQNVDDFTTDKKILDKYSQIHQGAVPFFVFGCRYLRLGSGEREGEQTEEKNLTALICKLTNNQPANVCAGVKDLVVQIKD